MKRVLAAMLSCLLAASLLTGCGGPGGGAAEPTPTPIPTPTATPIPTPETPVSPDAVVTTPEAEETPTPVDVEIHGEAETVDMTAISGSFAANGGPSFTVLVDAGRYQVNDMGGYCYITLRSGMSGDVYAELGFRQGQTAQQIGTSLLSEYGTMRTVSDLGTETLGSNTVYHVQGETVQNIFDAYLMDTIDGCLTMVVSSTAETGNHRTRLIASLETLTIS